MIEILQAALSSKHLINVFEDGWSCVSILTSTDLIWVRVEPKNDRLRIVEIRCDKGFDSTLLRAVPIAALESIINNQSTHMTNRTKNSMPFEKIRKRRIKHPGIKEVRRMKLSKPEDGKLSDEFLIRVANFYRQSVQIGKPPIVAISEEVKIPYGTADSWVRKARARGFLSRGDAGKVS